MYDSYQMPVEQRPFSLVDAVVGVFVRPVQALRSIAAARPWAWAIAIMLVLTVLGALVGLTAPLQTTPNIPSDSELSPGVVSMLSLMTQRGFLVAIGLLGPVFQIVYIGILFLCARMLSGQGRFSALFSTTIFSSLPSVLSLPLALVSNLLHNPTVSLGISAVSFVIWLWSTVLQVIGIRESMHFSTGRAVVTWLIPLAILLFLTCVLGIVFAGILIYAVRSTMPTFPTLIPTPTP